MKVCFIASSGGHLDELLMLEPLMKKYDSYIITEKTEYNTIPDRIKEKIYYFNQINRKEKLFFLNFIKLMKDSIKIMRKEKPNFIISTGALVCVPTCIIGKLLGKKVIFIESFANVNNPTLSGKIVHKVSDLFITQWESLNEFYDGAVYGGGIY